MTEAGFYQPGHRSPTALTIVILLHGAALTALALAKMDMPMPEGPVTTVVDFIKIKPPPEEIPPEPVEVQTPHVNRVTREVPIPLPPKPPEQRVTTRTIDTGTTFVRPRPPEAEPQPEPEARPEPVRRAARIDPRSELKPPYPASEQRAGTEGSVTVKVLIGADGRVKAAEKVRATNDAFFQATLRHALRNWRFRPATIDGRPIESSKVMTLHFKLDEAG